MFSVASHTLTQNNVSSGDCMKNNDHSQGKRAQIQIQTTVSGRQNDSKGETAENGS